MEKFQPVMKNRITIHIRLIKILINWTCQNGKQTSGPDTRQWESYGWRAPRQIMDFVFGTSTFCPGPSQCFLLTTWTHFSVNQSQMVLRKLTIFITIFCCPSELINCATNEEDKNQGYFSHHLHTCEYSGYWKFNIDVDFFVSMMMFFNDFYDVLWFLVD